MSTLPPVKPKAGEVYICRDKENEKGKHHVGETTGLFVVHQLLSCIKPCMQMTGHVTNIDGSCIRQLTRKEPHVKKSYIQISTHKGPSSEFVRHEYQLLPPNNSDTVLIHYLGDEKAKDGPERAYIRTCPSVLRSLENECKETTSAKAYKNHITKVPLPTHLAVKQPRNTKQVKNIRSKVLAQQRLSHDALYNLHELATDIPDFIHVIRTHPDLVCVCGHKSMLDELATGGFTFPPATFLRYYLSTRLFLCVSTGIPAHSSNTSMLPNT